MGSGDSSRHIAYHEAGHALVALLVGREVRSVSLTNRQTVLNSECLRASLAATGPMSAEDRQHCEEELRVALAGYGGEVVGLGEASFVTAHDQDLSQANVVHRALRERAGRRGSANSLRADVVNALEQNRRTLDRLAATLLAEGDLSAERVRELVGPLKASAV